MVSASQDAKTLQFCNYFFFSATPQVLLCTQTITSLIMETWSPCSSLMSSSPAVACCFSATTNKVSSDDGMFYIQSQGYRTMSVEAISKLKVNKYRLRLRFHCIFYQIQIGGKYWKGTAVAQRRETGICLISETTINFFLMSE